jgi:LacI family transcriptional regulator
MNQKDIAKKLGISQTAVSMALRGNQRISLQLRKRVQAEAKRMGYQPNAYLRAWMSNVRTGKNMSEQGVIALLIMARSVQEWETVDTFKLFHQGALLRAKELGYRLENFFLLAPEMKDKNIDRILTARGIKGIIIAPPYYGNRSLHLHWEKYAAIGVGFGWNEQELHRTVHDNLYNYTLAFNKLRKLGYKRIGTILDQIYIDGNRHGIKWYTAYLDNQNNLPTHERIPVLPLEGASTLTTMSAENIQLLKEKMKTWMNQWHPDAVLTIVGHQKEWLEEAGFLIPEELGLACLSLPCKSDFAGVNENSNVVGATAIEQVAAQIGRNEFGLPNHPLTLMIEGQWVGGSTVCKQS